MNAQPLTHEQLVHQVSRIIAKYWLFGDDKTARQARGAFDAAAREILTLVGDV